MNRVLVAGIGNIFLGDDAFGVEAVHALARRAWPPEIVLCDIGIRCLDLAFLLADGWSAVIVLDAVSRGQPPGTLYRIALDEDALAPSTTFDAHTVGVEHVRSLARQLGIPLPPMMLLGCEPASLLPATGADRPLSPPVAAALPRALDMTEALARALAASQPTEAVSS